MTTAARRERPWPWLPWGLGWVRHMTRPAESVGAPPIPYMDRYSLREQGPSGTNPWRLYMNHFLAPDSEGHHDHPSRWSFSFILWGSYTEEYFDVHEGSWGREVTPLRRRRVRWFNWLTSGGTSTRYHRIIELHPGLGTTGVWTIFGCGPLSGRGWGVWQPGHGRVAAKTPK